MAVVPANTPLVCERGTHEMPAQPVDVEMWCGACAEDPTWKGGNKMVAAVEVSTRACRTCKKQKAPSEFYKGKPDCKDCYRKKYPR